MRTDKDIIVRLADTARQSFGPTSDITVWLDQKLNPIGMTPREYIEKQEDTAESVLGHYLNYGICHQQTP